MTGKISLGVVALVRVSSAPLKPAGGQLVGCQGAGPGSETKKKIINQSKIFGKVENILVARVVFNPKSFAKRDKHEWRTRRRLLGQRK